MFFYNPTAEDIFKKRICSELPASFKPRYSEYLQDAGLPAGIKLKFNLSAKDTQTLLKSVKLNKVSKVEFYSTFWKGTSYRPNSKGVLTLDRDPPNIDFIPEIYLTRTKNNDNNYFYKEMILIDKSSTKLYYRAFIDYVPKEK